MEIVTGPSPAFVQQQQANQPDLVGQYGRLLQLKNLQAQQAMIPLQQQEAQQRLQAGALENQQRQMQVNDQQAMTKAMQEWDGKDIGGLVPLVIKNKGSAQAVMGLKAKALEMQQTYSKIAADDAATGQKNIETKMKKNDLISGAFSTVLQQPDEALPQAITSTAQDLAQQGLLDPQHLQVAQNIAQQPPAQARQALEIMRKGVLADSQLLEQSKQKASIASEQANTSAKQAEANWYAQNGGAPGVSAEMIQQADWLKKNPGKGPSDYKLWVMRNSPTAMVMNNQLGGAGNSDALDLAANNYRLSGQLPAGFARSPQTTSAIIARAAELDKQAGGAGIYANKTILGSYKGSLDQLQKNLSAVSAFEDTANRNIEMLKGIAAKVPDMGTRFANTPIRAISGSMIGTENMAAFKTALAPVQAEAAKILNSANLTGQLSDTARKELQDIIDGNMPYKSLVASLNVLQQDFKNRHDSYQQGINDLQEKIKNASSGENQQPSGGIGVGAVIEQNGHRYKVTAVDKNGKPTAADPI